MNNIQTFQVFPSIPEPISFLDELSRNLWWCWNLDAIELFRRIDPSLWKKAGRNPLTFLTRISQDRYTELARDESFLAHQKRVKSQFRTHLKQAPYADSETLSHQNPIAYFSMEFGLHESLPIYSGGLGILAGDHLKAASDKGLPLVGIGLLYRQGYFRQYLNPDGWQQEEYPEVDLYQLPAVRALDPNGREIKIAIEGPEGTINACVWKIMVGRIPLYLLDTNLVENTPAIRDITARLYAGDGENRLAQEVLLGIGGMRTLYALGLDPAVCHLNEGHSAFSSLERLSQIMQRHSVSLETALEIVPRTTIFTTHTPVAAGHDEFEVDLVRPYLDPLQKQLGTAKDEILSWGQIDKSNPESPLSMFVLGLRLAQNCNGVSRLHGRVARGMWAHVWPDRPEEEIPIGHITNGVHTPSYISRENALLFDRYLGPEWQQRPTDPAIINRIDEIYDEEIWRGHEMSRSRLVRTCRKLMVKQLARRNAPKAQMEEAEAVLDQDVLTIAFARRFATYKRANLLFADPERLEALISSSSWPVQFIFAGKAHPKDDEGKALIQRIIQFSQRPLIRGRVVFLENYNTFIARTLIQGADVWLNTPRRPYEACGTSGMKASLNGVLNLSVLDGWWDEAYTAERGWQIGNGQEYNDPAYQDAVESRALYNLLENEVIPCFYEEKSGDAPSRWVKMMKEAMKVAMADFSAHRMVNEYESLYYQPASTRVRELFANNGQEAVHLARKHDRFRSHWDAIRIKPPVRHLDGPYRVGENFRISTEVFLGDLEPEEIEMQLYYGQVKSLGELAQSHTQVMSVEKEIGDGSYLYECGITCNSAGRYGFTVRATPRGDKWIKMTPGLITWA